MLFKTNRYSERGVPKKYGLLEDVEYYSSIGISTLHRLVQSGEIPYIKVRGKNYFKFSDLEKWMDGQKVIMEKKNDRI